MLNPGFVIYNLFLCNFKRMNGILVAVYFQKKKIVAGARMCRYSSLLVERGLVGCWGLVVYLLYVLFVSDYGRF